MCGGIHYGEAEGLVSVERWSCSRGASCVVEYIMGGLTDCMVSVERWSFKGVEVDQGRKSALLIIMQLKTVTQVLITKC